MPRSLQAARNAYNTRKYDDAVAEFQQAHAACGQPQVTLLPLAQAQLLAQRPEASLQTLQTLLKVQPENLDALKLQGDVLYVLGRVQEAEKSLKSVLEVDGSHAGAQYALGRIYYQQNRFVEAIARFTAVIERDPTHYRAHDNLALCYAAVQQDRDALRHFLKALDLVHKDHPEYDTVYANAAIFFTERGEFQKAFQLGAEAASETLWKHVTSSSPAKRWRNWRTGAKRTMVPGSRKAGPCVYGPSLLARDRLSHAGQGR